MKKRGKLGVLFGIFFAFFGAITAIRIAGASGNTFKLTSAEITEKSPQTEAEIINFNDTEVSTRVEYHALNEYVTYKLGLLNSDSKTYKIIKISATSENPYLAYEYNEDFEATVAEGESFDFVLKTIYKTTVEDITNRDQKADVVITISYEDESGNVEEEEVIVVPNTYDDTAIPNTGSTEKDGSKAVPIFPFLVLLIGVIIAIAFYVKKHKKAAGITLAVTLALSIVAPLTALSTISDTITIKNQLGFYNKLNITYPTGSGTANKTIDYGEPGGDIPAPDAPEGYTFDGYADGDGNDYDPNAPITGDIDLTPKFTPIHYSVKFNKNADTATGTMEDITVAYDEIKTLPLNQFTRPGYSFTNWSLASESFNDGDSIKNLSSVDGATVTLNANWQAGTYTIHYDGNGATSGQVADQTVTFDTPDTLAFNGFTKDGYSFIDWVCDGSHYPAGANFANLATDKDQTITCVAQWSTVDFGISYVLNGGTATGNPDSYNAESGPIHLNNPTREGYNFTGWSGNELTGENNMSVDVAFEPYEAKTYTAHWSPIHFIFVFDANGGQGSMANYTFAYDDNSGEDVLPNNGFTHDGWAFTGWNTQADGLGTAYTPGNSVHNYTTVDNQETTLYAQWGSIPYDIIYNLDGGTANNYTVYSPETATFTLNNPTKIGYIFTGWSGTGLEGEDNMTVTITQSSYGAREYTAHFDPIQYTLHFMLGASPDEIADQPMYYDVAIPNSYNPSNTGYNFIGFALTENGDVAIAPGADIINLTTENGAIVNLYAKYEGHAYTVNYADSLCYKSALTVYDEEEEGTEMYISNLIPGDPQQEVWGTAFNVKDVELRKPSGEYNYVTTATYEPADIIAGTATFKYWASTRNCNGDNNIYYAGSSALNVLNQPVDNEVTLYAMWDLTEFTVRIHKNAPANSSITGPEYFDLDTKYTVIDDIQLPAQDGYGYNAPGYTLTGVANVPDFNEIHMGLTYLDTQAIATTQNCDLTTNICDFYVIWRPIKYHINYHNNGGNGATTAQSNIKYGDTFNLSDGTGYTREGYTLVGWSLTESANNTKDYDLGQSVSNLSTNNGWTVNFYAVWEATPQEITYNLNGGTADNPGSYTIEDQITLNNPTRAGYNFTGWSGTGLDGENNMSVTIPVGSQGACSYTAHWSTISYGITYTGLDDLTEDELALMHNPTSYTVENGFTLDVPTHAGYTFTGWTGDNGSTPQIIVMVPVGITGDLTYTANFRPNVYTVAFDKNPGTHTIGGSMEEQEFTYNVSQALGENQFTIDEAGFKYGGWNTEADGSGIHYDDKQSVTNLTDEDGAIVTLYAEWGRTPYTIAFDANNENATGTMLPVENIEYGEHVNLPACGFTYNDHKLASWNTEPDGSGKSYGDQVDVVNVAIDGTITLYAQWRDVEAIFNTGVGVNDTMKALADGNLANITAVRRYVGVPDTSNFTSANVISAFSSPDKIYAWMEGGTLYYWSEDNVPAMNSDARSMFANLSNATVIEVSNIDTSATTDMAWLFSGDVALQNIDLSGFNTGNVTIMHSMFKNCRALTSLNLSSFNTENVTSMISMFEGCSGLESLDITNFKTSEVNSFANMFYACSKLTNINVSKMDVSKATSTAYMFSKSGVVTVDMSAWNAPLLGNISHMFASCPNLETIDVSMLGHGNLTTMDYVFEVTPKLTSITFGDSFNVSSVRNMSGVFFSTSALKMVDISSFNTASATSMTDMFRSSALETVYASENFNTTGVSETASLFSQAIDIVGGMGTTYNGAHLNKDYARIDGGSTNPGYFTDKNRLNIFYHSNESAETGPVSGTMQSQLNLQANSTVTLNANQYTVNTQQYGRVFGGWNTEPDGSGRHFSDEETFDDAFGKLDLYAEWGKTPYTIIFNSNEPDGETVNGTMEDLTKEFGDRFNLPANQYFINGYAFMGWNSKQDGKGKHYDNEQEVVNLSVTGTVNLYAEWAEMTAVFDTGATVNSKMKGLVTTDHTIRKIKESTTAPDLNNIAYETLSIKGSYYPIYGWYDKNTETAYYWTEAEEFHLNANSAAMFDSLVDVTEIETTHFNTSRVTNMSAMFRNCPSLESLSIANWDTSKVTNMSQMFGRPDWGLKGDESLTVLDLSNWNTSAVTNMSNMFFGCKNLVEVKTDNWNTSAVTNMTSMFNGCSSLTTIDGTTLSTDAATTFESMFAGCSSLAIINASGWNTGNVTKMNNMFAGCTSLSSLNIKNWNTEKVTTMANMFGGLSYNGEGCKSLTSLDLGGWKTGNVTNMSQMFQGCTGLTTLNLAGWNTEKVTNMSGMFGGDQFKKGCESLTSLDVTHFNTSAVTTMSNMFNDVKTLTTLDVTHFNTSSVKDMSGLFAGMTSLTSIDVSHFDTSNVTTMANMFRGTNSLTNLDITAFNTSNVKSINGVFTGAGITEIDLTHFDARKVTDVGWFVYEARNLETIYANDNTDLSSANGYAPYFDTKLKGGANTGYSYSHLEAEYGRIDDPDNGKPGYFTPKNSRYIRYNANGGEGTMTSAYVSVSTLNGDTLKANEFTKEGYEFSHWTTNEDGTGDVYDDEQNMGGEVSSKEPLTLYAQWTLAQPNNSVSYKANGGTGAMGIQTFETADIQLSGPNFAKEGYGFLGWNTEKNGSGTMYGPNETVPIPESTKLKVYAQWIQSTGNLQGFDCSALASGAVTALTDTRDGQTYTIAKLDDGKCWMTENLRLDLSKYGDKINASNTNNPTSEFLTAVVQNPASLSDWCKEYDEECTNSLEHNNENIKNLNNTNTELRYGYGSYYNWYTATAGNGTQSVSGTNVSGDLCPSGWRMPTGQSTGEFGDLYLAMGLPDNNGSAPNYVGGEQGKDISNLFRSAPYNFTLSGMMSQNEGSVGQGSSGIFWSTYGNNPNFTRDFSVNVSDLTPGNGMDYKIQGYSIRCITE
ncbi:MAG: BspA family leucine-rich repeat surface protein [Candidatus Saccharibacteria bacterium]|nr:BspA family leucine-rich repeat surface protein [Candidatus Saccharibacteria bacterium]